MNLAKAFFKVRLRGPIPLLNIQVKDKSLFCAGNNLFTIFSQQATWDVIAHTSENSTGGITPPVR